MRRVDAISIDMAVPCTNCGQMGAGGRAQLCLACVGKVVEEKIRQRKERPVAGRKAKPIELELQCPHCGKSIEAKVKKVVDEPATPAETHWEAEVVKGSGGLLDVP